MIRPSESMQLQLIWQTGRPLMFSYLLINNYHAAGASVRGHDTITDSSEPRGATSSTIICRSWNRGPPVHCTIATCRFAHKCQSCFGHHRVKDCPRDSSSQQSAQTVTRLSSMFSQQVQVIVNALKAFDFVSCYILVTFEGEGMFCVIFLLCCLLAYVLFY